MTTSSAQSPKVFISYTHDSPEHMDGVLELSNRLRAEGVDCHLDQYETSPPEGWPRWTNRQLEAADYVLVVCTEVYQRRFNGTEESDKGLGAQWEGAIITQELYESATNNEKFIPVLISPEDSGHIPHVLRGVQVYDLSSEEGYTQLYRRLTKQPWVTKPDRGGLRSLPTRERKQYFFNIWNIPYEANHAFFNRKDVLSPRVTEKNQSQRKLRAFLCHASADKETVRTLYRRLWEDGVEPWLDEEDLLPGQDWELEITNAVRTADVVIVCLSKKAVTKAGFVQKEIRVALEVAEEQPEGVIYIIPLRLEECTVPTTLRRWQWVDYFLSQGYERLLRALRTRAIEHNV